MAQKAKVFSTKTDNLSSMPRTYMVERQNSHKLSSVLHTHSVACMNMQINKSNLKYLKRSQRDDLVVKSIGCCSGDLGLITSIHVVVTTIQPRTCLGQQVHLWYTDVHANKTSIHIKDKMNLPKSSPLSD